MSRAERTLPARRRIEVTNVEVAGVLFSPLLKIVLFFRLGFGKPV